MRETIVIQHTAGLSADETQSLRAGFESEGWSGVLVKSRPDLAGSGWKAYEWSGIRKPAEPAETVELVNVTSRDPDHSEILEALDDDGIRNVKIDYFTEPYRFEDGFQISTVFYRQQ